MAKPTVIPEWAISIINDPTSGINNRVQPSAGEQNTGDVPLNIKPSRQHHNWLQYMNGEWIKYFDTMLIKLNQPVFMFPGKITFNWINASSIWTLKTEYDDAPAPTRHSEYLNLTQNLTGISKRVGIPLVRQSFRKPTEFNKLDLTFLGKSSVDLGATPILSSVVLGNQATADSLVTNQIAVNDITGSSLFSGSILRSIQLDLTALSAGDPVQLIHHLYIPDVSAPAADFNIEMGQLYSGWTP